MHSDVHDAMTKSDRLLRGIPLAFQMQEFHVWVHILCSLLSVGAVTTKFVDYDDQPSCSPARRVDNRRSLQVTNRNYNHHGTTINQHHNLLGTA